MPCTNHRPKYRYIGPLLMLVTTCIAGAQAVLIPPQLTGRQSPARDTHAVQVIESAIEVMGGHTGLRAINKAHSTWIVSDPNSPGSTSTATWDDDWSAGLMAFTHQMTNSQGIHILSADRNHNVLDQEPSGTSTLPPNLQDIALPWGLPAVALQLELTSPNYKFEYLGLNKSTAIVRITRITSQGFADPFSIQVWRIDLSTGLPSGLLFYTEDLTHHVPTTQSLKYSAYKQFGDLKTPTLLLFNEKGNPVSMTLTSLSFD